MNPEVIIQQQVEAYNTRNIDAFVGCHHPQVKLYNFGDPEPFAQGRKKVREIYSDVFDNSPNLYSDVKQRIVMGNTVIDYETITGRKGIEVLEIIAIYEVEEGLIGKAHFIRN